MAITGIFGGNILTILNCNCTNLTIYGIDCTRQIYGCIYAFTYLSDLETLGPRFNKVSSHLNSYLGSQFQTKINAC